MSQCQIGLPEFVVWAPSQSRYHEKPKPLYVITSPRGRLLIPRITLVFSASLASVSAQLADDIPDSSYDQREGQRKMKATGNRPHSSNPVYNAGVRTRALSALELRESAEQLRSRDRHQSENRKRDVLTLPVPRGPDGKFI